MYSPLYNFFPILIDMSILTRFTWSRVLDFQVTPFLVLSLPQLTNAGICDVISATQGILVVTHTDSHVSFLVQFTGKVVPTTGVVLSGQVADLALGLGAYLATFTPVAGDPGLAGHVLLFRAGAAIADSTVRGNIVLSHGETKEAQETRHEHDPLHSDGVKLNPKVKIPKTGNLRRGISTPKCFYVRRKSVRYCC